VTIKTPGGMQIPYIFYSITEEVNLTPTSPTKGPPALVAGGLER
jgi:hypothetical protein